MEGFYLLLIVLSIAGIMGVQMTRKHVASAGDTAFKAFKRNYVVVLSLMMAGDWLQGPYVYKLYDQYGFSRGDIGKLFIAGFGASLLIGTFVGSLADRLGRKFMAGAYVLTYSLSCLTKHSSGFRVLLVGRILGGTATSLLFSVFESWVVAEHRKRRFNDGLLGEVFAAASFFGSGVAAIGSGLVASFLVETLHLGTVAPFDLAILVLLAGWVLILGTWEENYGERDPGAKPKYVLVSDADGSTAVGAPAPEGRGQAQAGLAALTGHVVRAAQVVLRDRKVAALGACQALFEGAMYCFVFLWTPALEAPASAVPAVIPHGTIFACFMCCSMVGSSLAEGLLESADTSKVLQTVFGVASTVLGAPTVISWLLSGPLTQPGSGVLVAPDGMSLAAQVTMLAFLIYEATVGIFWPAMMKMRAQHVPEEVRSAVINLFRMPVNLFVCVVLFKSGELPINTTFSLCSLMVGAGVLLLRVLLQPAAARPGADDDGR